MGDNVMIVSSYNKNYYDTYVTDVFVNDTYEGLFKLIFVEDSLHFDNIVFIPDEKDTEFLNDQMFKDKELNEKVKDATLVDRNIKVTLTMSKKTLIQLKERIEEFMENEQAGNDQMNQVEE